MAQITQPELAENELDTGKLAEVDAYIDEIHAAESSLIMVLHKGQEIFGYLPVSLQNHIAHRLNVPSSKVFGVVTFYSFFNQKPKGRFKCSVCLGTACFVRGSQAILDKLEGELKIKTGEVTQDGLFSIDAIRCVGACGLAPVMTVNGRVFGRLTPDDVPHIVEEFMAEVGR